MTPEIYIAAFFIIIVAYFLRGITGFGSALIAVPLLAHYFPLTFVVPLVLVLDFISSVVLSRHMKKQVRWDEIRLLLPSSLIGILLGSFLLVNLPREPMLVGLGLFVIFFGIRYVFNIHSDKLISRLWSIPAGFTGGLIGALFGTGGPPYVIYLAHRLNNKTQQRSTISGFFMLDGALRITAFLFMGLFIQNDLLVSLLFVLPLAGLGLYLGNKVHVGISHRQQLMLIGGLLVLSGASLLWKAWA